MPEKFLISQQITRPSPRFFDSSPIRQGSVPPSFQFAGIACTQNLSVGVKKGRLIFSPHLLPTDRGILAAIYAPVKNAHQAIEAIKHAYGGEPLVNLLPEGNHATLGHVVRTPYSAISLTPATENTLIIMVAIDNLLKGAASQAVQNFNLMFGFNEATGLTTTAQSAAP